MIEPALKVGMFKEELLVLLQIIKHGTIKLDSSVLIVPLMNHDAERLMLFAVPLTCNFLNNAFPLLRFCWFLCCVIILLLSSFFYKFILPNSVNDLNLLSDYNDHIEREYVVPFYS